MTTEEETKGAVERLEPCPFVCKTLPYLTAGHNNTRWVECSDCGAQGPTSWSSDDEAVQLWNTRASTNSPRSQGKGEARTCTCHPDEAPTPCQRGYALSVCLRSAQPAEGGDGLLEDLAARSKAETKAFERWAQGQDYDMAEHPLHYLFLNEKTYAARQGWKAALEFAIAKASRPSTEAGGERKTVMPGRKSLKTAVWLFSPRTKPHDR